MIIGIDYTAAAWQGAGIGRYTRELVRAAVTLQKTYSYVLFYASGGLSSESTYRRELEKLCATYPHVRAVPLPFSPRLLTILWQRLRLPLMVEYFTGYLDIVHAPDFVLPPTRARTILTVHDLTFLVQPTCFEPSLQRYLARVVPRSIAQADLVLVDSQATRHDLLHLLNVALDRSVLLYPGIDSRFCPLPTESIEAVRQRLGLPHQFWLFVGTLEPRKNLVRLLEAYHHVRKQLGNQIPMLVIAGRKGWLYQSIFDRVQELELESQILFLDFVNDEDLPALYNLAEIFVYPSLYEGFGLPVAEALACGTAVVTANAASLPEVAGDAAILVDPYDSQSIADGLMQATQETRRLEKAGPRQIRRFMWQQSAYTLLACYLRVMNNKERSIYGSAS